MNNFTKVGLLLLLTVPLLAVGGYPNVIDEVMISVAALLILGGLRASRDFRK